MNKSNLATVIVCVIITNEIKSWLNHSHGSLICLSNIPVNEVRERLIRTFSFLQESSAYVKGVWGNAAIFQQWIHFIVYVISFNIQLIFPYHS